VSVSNCCISQGSVATYLRYGGGLLEISFSLQECKNFWNRLRFDKVIAKVRDHSFFGTLYNLVTIFSTRFDNWTFGRSKQKHSWQDLTSSMLLMLTSLIKTINNKIKRCKLCFSEFKSRIIEGGAENAGQDIAGQDNDGQTGRARLCRTWQWRTREAPCLSRN